MMEQRTIFRAAGLCFLLGAVVFFAGATDTAYQGAVSKWRQNYEASLKADDGWLTVAGLFWLHEGENRFGADALNDIVLPGGSAPAEAGSFVLHNRKVAVKVRSGVPITLSGKAVQTAELHPDAPADELKLGSLTLWVHASGERLGIRLRDENSKLRKEFTGLHWFPIDESYRVKARYVAYTPPKPVEIQNVLGDFDKGAILGYAVFTLHGQEYRLEATEDEPGKLFFVFRDLTSGKETYPAARFLDADLPQNGSVVLDFNEAYNPPCAYNPYTTCPLPLPQNRLRVAIPAGEKIYQREHGR